MIVFDGASPNTNKRFFSQLWLKSLMTYQKQQEASGEIRITQIGEYKLKKKMEAKILIKTFKDQQMDQNQKGLTRFN